MTDTTFAGLAARLTGAVAEIHRARHGALGRLRGGRTGSAVTPENQRLGAGIPQPVPGKICRVYEHANGTKVLGNDGNVIQIGAGKTQAEAAENYLKSDHLSAQSPAGLLRSEKESFLIWIQRKAGKLTESKVPYPYADKTFELAQIKIDGERAAAAKRRQAEEAKKAEQTRKALQSAQQAREQVQQATEAAKQAQQAAAAARQAQQAADAAKQAQQAAAAARQAQQAQQAADAAKRARDAANAARPAPVPCVP